MNKDKDIIFATKYGEIRELEKIIENVSDMTQNSPFNPMFFKFCLLEDLTKRLYQKKRRLNLNN